MCGVAKDDRALSLLVLRDYGCSACVGWNLKHSWRTRQINSCADGLAPSAFLHLIPLQFNELKRAIPSKSVQGHHPSTVLQYLIVKYESNTTLISEKISDWLDGAYFTLREVAEQCAQPFARHRQPMQ